MTITKRIISLLVSTMMLLSSFSVVTVFADGEGAVVIEPYCDEDFESYTQYRTTLNGADYGIATGSDAGVAELAETGVFLNGSSASGITEWNGRYSRTFAIEKFMDSVDNSITNKTFRATQGTQLAFSRANFETYLTDAISNGADSFVIEFDIMIENPNTIDLTDIRYCISDYERHSLILKDGNAYYGQMSGWQWPEAIDSNKVDGVSVSAKNWYPVEYRYENGKLTMKFDGVEVFSKVSENATDVLWNDTQMFYLASYTDNAVNIDNVYMSAYKSGAYTISVDDLSLCDNNFEIKGSVAPASPVKLTFKLTDALTNEIRKKTITVGEDGTFSDAFVIETPDDTGVYTINIEIQHIGTNYTDTFTVYDAADRISKLDFTSKTTDEVIALLFGDQFFYDLDIGSGSLFDSLTNKNEVYSSVSGKAFQTVQELKDVFSYKVTFVGLKEKTEPAIIAQLLEENKSVFNLDLTGHYKDYTLQICELLVSNVGIITDEVALDKFIKTAEMFYALNFATRINVVDVLNSFVDDDEYYDILKDCGLDEDYETVDSSIQVAAASSILDAGLSLTNNFNLATEMAKLVGAVNAVVNAPVEEPEPEPTYTPSYSGGGGFGSVTISKKEDTKKEGTPVVPQPVVTPEPANNDYTDVYKNHWAADAIYAVRDKGIMTGDGSGNFYPDNYLKREEMAKIIVEAFEITSENDQSSFTDITEDMWCNKYITTADGAGLINGISENEFGFGNVMTRQDIAVIVYRYLLQKEFDFEEVEVEEFSDETEIADYAKDAVKFMQKYNLMVGSDGKFNPRQPLTRAMAAKIICNITSK